MANGSVDPKWYRDPPPGFSRINNYSCWLCGLSKLYELDMAHQMRLPGTDEYSREGVCWECLYGKEPDVDLVRLPEVLEKIVPGSGRSLMPSKRMQLATHKYVQSGKLAGLPSPERMAAMRKAGGDAMAPM